MFHYFNQYKSLSYLILILAYIEMIAVVVLAVYTFRSTQILGEALSILMYVLAGIIFAFAFAKNISLSRNIRMLHLEVA